MEVYLVRHAESQNNALHESQRIADPPLTERGKRQADRLAHWAAEIRATQLLTSPFRRALDTLAPTARRTMVPVEVWTDLHERGGCYDGWGDGPHRAQPGLGRKAILEAYPQFEIEPELPDEGWWQGEGREADHAAIERAQRLLERLRSRFGGTSAVVIAVTHADFKRLLLEQILEQNPLIDRFGPLINTGVTHLREWRGRWRIDGFNAASHLPAELITPQAGLEAPGSMPPLATRLVAT
jgi:broad specificity phosphatase PhoE